MSAKPDCSIVQIFFFNLFLNKKFDMLYIFPQAKSSHSKGLISVFCQHSCTSKNPFMCGSIDRFGMLEVAKTCRLKKCWVYKLFFKSVALSITKFGMCRTDMGATHYHFFKKKKKKALNASFLKRSLTLAFYWWYLKEDLHICIGQPVLIPFWHGPRWHM